VKFNSRLDGATIRSAFVAVFVLIIVVTAQQVALAQYLHPKVVSKQTTIRKIVLLPAKIEVVKDSMKGPEGMAAESDLLGARVNQLVTEVLATKSVASASGPAAGAEGGDAQQKYTIADIQSRYDALLPKIAKKKSDVKKGRFSLGDEVLNLNVDKTADAIVFVRGHGQRLTKGKTAFTLLVGGMPAYLRMSIGIVDAHSGELLLYTDPVAVGDPTNPNDTRLRKAIEKSLKKLPPAS